MLSWSGVRRRGRRLAGAWLGACLALGFAQGAHAEIYAWRTDDGGYAYTDDKDQIPARYRAQAKALSRTSLSSYERYTPQDGASSARYAERLERRLMALRAANTAAPQPAAQASAAPVGSGTLLVSTGGENASQIEVPMASEGAAPVVVEPGLSKRTGDLRTRRVTVVKQGERTIAVILGPPHNFDPVSDILDEDELVE
jgi:hypothetical protein